MTLIFRRIKQRRKTVLKITNELRKKPSQCSVAESKKSVFQEGRSQLVQMLPKRFNRMRTENYVFNLARKRSLRTSIRDISVVVGL